MVSLPRVQVAKGLPRVVKQSGSKRESPNANGERSFLGSYITRNCIRYVHQDVLTSFLLILQLSSIFIRYHSTSRRHEFRPLDSRSRFDKVHSGIAKRGAPISIETSSEISRARRSIIAIIRCLSVDMFLRKRKMFAKRALNGSQSFVA